MKMLYFLIAAVAAGAGIGGARGLASSTPHRDTDAEPLAAAPEAPPEAPGSPPTLGGEVLEVVQVPGYTYLRLGEKGAPGTWAAVPTVSVEVGATARVRDAMKMTDFTSTALKRTFPVIYFGTLAGEHAAHGAARDLDPHAAAQGPHAATGPVPVRPVARATGPEGRTVAELIARRAELVGRTVRIHATVVKSTPNILGRTYLHLRDGSGDASAGTHDVAVTTEATPAVGDTVVVEGVVAIDRDIGAGYRFPTIVENARILSAP